MAQYLDRLIPKYERFRPGNDSFDPMGDLVQRYRQYKNSLPIDLAAVATSLTLDSGMEIDPLALKAIQDTNPNFNPDKLGDYSSEELMGIVNSAKGKYFEYLVVENLNAGETVGDVTLPDGYQAALAGSMNQPGWDLRIMDENGRAAELLQLKATASSGYIHDTLERYPDIVILATDEVANGMPHDSTVLDSNISEAELEKTINGTLAGHQTGFLGEFWDSFNPLIPLLVIAGTQGYQVAVNKQRVSSALEVAKARAARGLVAAGVGAVFKAITDSLIISIPAGLLAGWYFDRGQNIDGLVEAIRNSNKKMLSRSEFYRNLANRDA